MSCVDGIDKHTQERQTHSYDPTIFPTHIISFAHACPNAIHILATNKITQLNRISDFCRLPMRNSPNTTQGTRQKDASRTTAFTRRYKNQINETETLQARRERGTEFYI